MAKVWKFGNNVDTDAIIPARYLVTTDPAELAKNCMEASSIPDFAKRVSRGDVIVAGNNFGCGSSREHAPVSIRGCGVACVIAASFARIFLRNSVNIGLTVLECPEAAAALRGGETVTVDAERGTIAVQGGATFQAKPLPPFVMDIVRAGGLMNYTKQRMATRPLTSSGPGTT